MTRAELAAVSGRTRQAIYKAVRAGRLTEGPDGIDPADPDTLRFIEAGRAVPDQARAHDADADRVLIIAKIHAELGKLRRARSEAVPVVLVDAALSALATTVTRHLTGPGVPAPSSDDREVAGALASAVTAALESAKAAAIKAATADLTDDPLDPRVQALLDGGPLPERVPALRDSLKRVMAARLTARRLLDEGRYITREAVRRRFSQAGEASRQLLDVPAALAPPVAALYRIGDTAGATELLRQRLADAAARFTAACRTAPPADPKPAALYRTRTGARTRKPASASV